MRIFWTDAALNQLEAIRDYFAQTSPDYAQRLVEQHRQPFGANRRVPAFGRAVPEYDIDEVRQIIEGSYRIIYLIKPDQIEVLALIHTARRGLPQE